MDIFDREVFYNARLTPPYGVDTSAYRIGLDLGFAEYPPGGVIFRVTRIDARPSQSTFTTPDDLTATLLYVEPHRDVPDTERLNVMGSAAIYAFWAALDREPWGPQARMREATRLKNSPGFAGV